MNYHMWQFTKNREKVLFVTDNKIHSCLKVNKQFLKQEVLMSIESLQLHFSAPKEEAAIRQIGKQSLESFFRYWIQKKGWKAFIDHMLNLGFNLTKVEHDRKLLV